MKKMKKEKDIDYYLEQVKELDEFNKSYSLGVDVYRIFQANVYSKTLYDDYKNKHEVWIESVKATHDTLEAKLQYMYGIHKKIKLKWT